MSQYLQGLPVGPAVNPKTGQLTMSWAAWMNQAQQLLADVGNSGTTAQRPVTQLYIGKPYFDTTLGYAINVQSVNPTVWVNGAGAPV